MKHVTAGHLREGPVFRSNEALRSAETCSPGLSREHVARTWSIAPGEVVRLDSAKNPHGPSPRGLSALTSLDAS